MVKQQGNTVAHSRVQSNLSNPFSSYQMATATADLTFVEEGEAFAFARTGTPVVEEDPFFFLITLHEDGTLEWALETRSTLDWAEPLGTGIHMLTFVTEEPQIVSPEWFGITQDQLHAYCAAADRFQRYAYDGRTGSSDDEYQARVDTYELEVTRHEEVILAAIREQRDLVEKVFCEMMERENGPEDDE